jgi:hypothetical protein
MSSTLRRPCRHRHRRDAGGASGSTRAAAAVLTPDDIMDGRLPDGPTLVFDGEGYYMGGVIAERLRAAGLPVTLCTPSDSVAPMGRQHLERWRVRTRLMELGVGIETAQTLVAFDGRAASLECAYSGSSRQVPLEHVVMVTAREPADSALQRHTRARQVRRPALHACPHRRLRGPGIIAAAVHAGHRYARELDGEVDPDVPLRHERKAFHGKRRTSVENLGCLMDLHQRLEHVSPRHGSGDTLCQSALNRDPISARKRDPSGASVADPRRRSYQAAQPARVSGRGGVRLSS